MDVRGIRKKGVLKKLKRGHKKFFVLHERSDTGPARLEYYDKEVLFLNGNPPKRSIELRTCFNISKMSDKKHKYMIKLFTKDDCFSIVHTSEEDRDEWFTALEALQNEEDDPERTHYEHIWQVEVKAKGLGNQITPGPYRLCLRRHLVSLVHTSSDKTFEFQLVSIKRYGHTNNFFYMEVGRSCQTGSGELWMQVEDGVIARNMHEVLRCFNEKSRTDSAYRNRTLSAASDINPPSSGCELIRSGSDASSSPRMLSVQMRPRIGTAGTAGGLVVKKRRNSSSSHESHGTAGSQSDQESDDSVPHLHPGSAHELDGSYIPMDHNTRDEEFVVSSQELILPQILVSGSQNEYEAMTPVGQDEYISMSPPTGEMGYSSSPAVSTASSHDPEEPYLPMTMSPLPTVQEGADTGYIPMSPQVSLPVPDSLKQRPDTVKSYLQDDEVDPGQMREHRAYSLGSKQYNKRNNAAVPGYMPMDISSKLDKAGSKSSSAPHLVDKDKATTGTQTPGSSSSRSSSRAADIDSFMEMDFNKNSEPRPRTSSGGKDLRPRTGSFGQEYRKRASSFGKEGGSVLRQSRQDGGRYRTTTICQDQFRNRTSSFSASDFRPRAYSDTRFRCTYADSRHSSSDSMRRHLQRTSQESLGSHQHSSEYLDMSKHAPVPEHSIPKDSAYASMTPGDAQENYMDMTPGMSVSPSHGGERSRRSTSRTSSGVGKTIYPTGVMHMKVPGAERRASPDQPGEYIDIDFSNRTERKNSTSSSRSISPAVSKSGSPVPSSLPLSVSPTVVSPLAVEASRPLTDSYAIYKPGGEIKSDSDSRLTVVYSAIVPEDPKTPAHLVSPPSITLPVAKPSLQSKQAAMPDKSSSDVKLKTAPPLPPMPTRTSLSSSPGSHNVHGSHNAHNSKNIQSSLNSMNSHFQNSQNAQNSHNTQNSENSQHSTSSKASVIQTNSLPPVPQLPVPLLSVPHPPSATSVSSPRASHSQPISIPGCTPPTVDNQATRSQSSPQIPGCKSTTPQARQSQVDKSPELFQEGTSSGESTPRSASPISREVSPSVTLPAPFTDIAAPVMQGSAALCLDSEVMQPPRPASAQPLSTSTDSYMNLDLSIPRNASESSMGALAGTIKTEDQLHYASLDLSSSTDDCCPGEGSSSRPILNSDSENEPVSYSQVDFVKSESLRLSSNLQKNTRVPFEL